jgi:hypothetical protein
MFDSNTCANCGYASDDISVVRGSHLCGRCAELSHTCPDCGKPAESLGDFCSKCIPLCEICGGDIPFRLAGVRYANCGSRSCENRYYED